MENLLQAWQEVATILKEKIQPVTFNTWIKPIIPTDLSDTHITLQVPNEYNKTMICDRYNDLIKNSLFLVLGKDYEIEVVIVEETEEIEVKEEKKEPVKFEETNSMLLSQYTFDNYVIGNSNKFVHAIALAVAESPSTLYNPLYLHGGVGLGKTHLMNAIGNHFLKIYPDKKVMYVSSEQFTYELVEAIKTQKNADFRNKYRNIDLLMIDDIQFIGGKASSEEEFFNTFNALHQSNKQIVISGDRPPKELHTLEKRLRTRFESGQIIEVAPPDFEMRAAILKQKAEQFNLNISYDIIDYIAARITSNIRELEGAIKKLTAYSILKGNNSSIDMETVSECLKDFNTIDPNLITEETIIRAVEKYFNLKEGSIISSRKTKDIAFGRQIVMYLMRDLLDLSYTAIGQSLGGRDHTTVMHGVEKIDNFISNDMTIKNVIEDIKKNIKNR
ncbi:MAG: chromosomal replication initiator protein DnaA [Ruminococcaceae bacterium]|nr:chromosomal replication initiator protein DnaA [Oscillospiraceae bacterium]